MDRQKAWEGEENDRVNKCGSYLKKMDFVVI